MRGHDPRLLVILKAAHGRMCEDSQLNADEAVSQVVAGLEYVIGVQDGLQARLKEVLAEGEAASWPTHDSEAVIDKAIAALERGTLGIVA